MTHLKGQRVKTLVKQGIKYAEANAQAQNELLSAFGLQKYAGTDVSQFSFTGGTEESDALIAVSSLLLSFSQDEAELTQYLGRLSREMGENGKFSEETIKQMRENLKYLSSSLPYIRERMIEYYKESGLDIRVNDLTRFFDWDNDGIAGNEVLEEGQVVTLETTELNVPNEGGDYTIHFSSPIPFVSGTNGRWSKCDRSGYLLEGYV